MARMKNVLTLITLATFVTLLLFVVFRVQAQTATDETSASAEDNRTSDERASGEPLILIPQAYQADKAETNAAASSTATIYFTPQDSDNTNTILFLYNTGDSRQSVSVESFDSGGYSVIPSTSIGVPAKGMVRISADTLITSPTPPASWADTAIINFTDSSLYARLGLPGGVKVEGYVVWSESSTEHNPRAAMERLPLRFSTDPATVFMPTVQDTDT